MNSYSHMPFARIVLTLMIGIGFSSYIGVDSTIILIILCAALIAGIVLIHSVRHSYRPSSIYSTGALIYICIFLLGAFVHDYHNSIHEKQDISQHLSATHYRAKTATIPIEKKRSYKIITKLNAYRDSLGEWHPCTGKVMLYTTKSSEVSELQYGDIIVFENRITPISGPRNPEEFNYKKHLARRHIHFQVFLSQRQYILQKQHLFSLMNLSHRLRDMMKKTLDKAGLKGDNLAIASALLLGEKSLLDRDMKQAFANSGAMHILAVSGLHVGIIYLILYHLLSLLFKKEEQKGKKLLLIIVLLWLYALITGLSPSVIRAATMFSFISIGQISGIKQSIFNTIACSAFILLLFNPNYMFEVGFQLSYMAVLGIVIIHPIIYGWVVFSDSMLDRIWSLSAVSIAAQLATFPLSLYYFHIFPTYFLITNLLVIPAAMIIMYLGVLLFTFAFIEPIFQWIAYELDGILSALNICVQWIESLSFSVVKDVYISMSFAALLYLLVIHLFLVGMYRRAIHVYTSLIIIILLISLNINDIYNYRRHDYICIYDIKKASAINLIGQDYNILLKSDNLGLTKKDYAMQGNWIRHGGTPVRFLNITELPNQFIYKIASNIIGISGKSIAFISQHPYPLPQLKLNIDYLIITNYEGIDLSEILKQYDASLVILDGSFPPYIARKYIQKLNQTNIYSVSINGGIEKRLD